MEARPTRLSVTEIEHWLRDPYTIYAKHILRLTPLDEPEDLDVLGVDMSHLAHRIRAAAAARQVDPKAGGVDDQVKGLGDLVEWYRAEAV